MSAVEMKRAVTYTRVSTEKQVDHGTSLATQRDKCRGFAEQRGWTVVTEYADEGISGADESRPALDRMMASARRGEFDVVVVAKLDRLGRTMRGLSSLWADLDDLGVDFVSVSDGMDFTTPTGKFTRTMLGGFAEMERSTIKVRTSEGLRARARAGEWPGGPAPFGFRIDGEVRKEGGSGARLAVDDAEAAVLRRATDLIVDDGCTTWTAAQTLNGLGLTPRKADRWVHNHLRRVLLSPTLGGVWVYKTKEDGDIPMEIPAILAPERHAALLACLGASSTGARPSKVQSYYLLSHGRLTGACGAPHHGVSRKARGSRFYRCQNARPEAAHRCEDQWVHADGAEAAVWAEVVALLSEPDRLLQMADEYLGLRDAGEGDHVTRLREIDAKLAALEEARTGQVVSALKAGVAAEVLQQAVAEIESEESALRAHRARIERQQEVQVTGSDRLRRIEALARDARGRLGQMTPHERGAVLELLDVRVEVTGWSVCPACEGRGKTKGGRGGLKCETCHAMRRVPSLRLVGVLPADLERLGAEQLGDGKSTSHASEVPDVPLPFALELAMAA